MAEHITFNLVPSTADESEAVTPHKDSEVIIIESAKIYKTNITTIVCKTLGHYHFRACLNLNELQIS